MAGLGIPVSTTQAISGAIMGVGSTIKLLAVGLAATSVTLSKKFSNLDHNSSDRLRCPILCLSS
jgi:phosphate/sulfate permease